MLSPWFVIAAVDNDADSAFAEVLPLPPVSAPKTELWALEESDEPIAAVAVPPEWNEPVATSSPLLLPVMPPRLIEKLFTPLGVLTATERSAARAATDPVPVPLVEPATFELADAESEPLVAVALPLAPNEAVPPVLLARPLEIEPATAA